MTLPPNIVCIQDRRTDTRDIVQTNLLREMAKDSAFCALVGRYRQQYANGYEALAQIEERRIWNYLREQLDSEFAEQAFEQLREAIQGHRQKVSERVRAQAPAARPQNLGELLRAANLDMLMENPRFREASQNYFKAVQWNNAAATQKWRGKLWGMLKEQMDIALVDPMIDRLKEIAENNPAVSQER